MRDGALDSKQGRAYSHLGRRAVVSSRHSSTLFNILFHKGFQGQNTRNTNIAINLIIQLFTDIHSFSLLLVYHSLLESTGVNFWKFLR